MIFNKRTLFILTKSVILGYLVISNCFAIDNPNDTDLIIEGESLENTIDKQIKASGTLFSSNLVSALKQTRLSLIKYPINLKPTVM
jgi:hypothetical protein